MSVMYQVKGDSRRLGKRASEGAAVQLKTNVVGLLKWRNSPGRIWGGGAGVEAGGMIAAMIAVTTVRRNNKSNYKDGHRGTDLAAV